MLLLRTGTTGDAYFTAVYVASKERQDNPSKTLFYGLLILFGFPMVFVLCTAAPCCDYLVRRSEKLRKKTIKAIAFCLGLCIGCVAGVSYISAQVIGASLTRQS